MLLDAWLGTVLALTICGLSVGVGIGQVARREMTTGLLVGLVLAAAMLLTISWLWHALL
jgi:Mg/Co/Ni transporter MgtE